MRRDITKERDPGERFQGGKRKLYLKIGDERISRPSRRRKQVRLRLKKGSTRGK